MVQRTVQYAGELLESVRDGRLGNRAPSAVSACGCDVLFELQCLRPHALLATPTRTFLEFITAEPQMLPRTVTLTYEHHPAEGEELFKNLLKYRMPNHHVLLQAAVPA